MLPKVAIVIVNWNGKSDTLECINSLLQDKYENKQIIVVDNGSSDASVLSIQTAFPEIIVIKTGINLGFTGGNNVGIRFALKVPVDYVYLLNNDTTVEPGSLLSLVDACENNSEYGLLSPVIHYFDRPMELWFAGSIIDLSRGIAVHDNQKNAKFSDPLHEIPWASGCAMLIRSELIQRVGGFDDRFFLNWEDVDLSLRIRAQGSKIGIVPASRVYHKVGRSFARASGVSCYYYVRNHLLLAKLYSGKEYPKVALSIIAARFRENFRAIKNRTPERIHPWPHLARAIRDHLRHRYGSIAS